MPDLKKMLTLEALSEALPSWLKRSTKPEYNADEIDSTLTTNQFVTASDKDTWNAKGTYSKPSGGIPKSDLSSIVQTSLEKADSALQSETDPTVPSWAKASSKPSYTQDEVPDGSTYKRVTQNEKDAWSGKQNALTTVQMSAVNSGITSEKVGQISTNQVNILYVLGKTGKNLADPELFIDGGYISNSTGAVQPSETLSYMDYLVVNPNTEYYITTQTGNNWGAWYDANKKFISGLSSYGVKTSPANAKYLRCTLNGDYSTTFMVCTKADYDVSSAYESFKGKPNSDLTRLEAEDRASLAEVVDSGAKNKLKNNSYTCTGSPGRYGRDDSLSIPAGDYVLIAKVNQNQNSALTLMWDGNQHDFNAGGSISNTVKTWNVHATNTITSAWVYFNGTNDTWTDVMLCTLADWKVSQKYVPYQPDPYEKVTQNISNSTTMYAKRAGRVVTINGYMDNISFTANTGVTIGTIDDSIGKPPQQVRAVCNVGSNAYSVGKQGYVTIQTDGNIRVTSEYSGTGAVYFSVSYVL